ncbi:MAG TPA: hypothetical protein VFI48_02985 [Hyphomicrobiaceae bacterium]|nr:hypothetical protein [Hyphomicrobiaceae bacterium]
MTFANVGFPAREPMLASGEVDVVFGFSFSILMHLRSCGVPGDDIVPRLMSDQWCGALRQSADGLPEVRRRSAGGRPKASPALTKGRATTATASVIKRNLGMARHVEGD